jgi:hypothetical protein
MKEEIAQIVERMISTFKGSRRAQLWYTFTDAVREDMIDACVMDQVRNAAVYSEAHAFTMSDLMDIRRCFIRSLHAGIPQRGKDPVTYVLEAFKAEGPP